MKEHKRQAEKEEEEEFRQQMIAKFAEDDRLELMNAQKRRMKQLEHRRAVEKLIEERRQQYQLEKVNTCTYMYIHMHVHCTVHVLYYIKVPVSTGTYYTCT